VITQGIELGWDEVVVKASFDLSLSYAVCDDIPRSLEVARQSWKHFKESEVITYRVVAARTLVIPLLLRGEFMRAKPLLEDIMNLEASLHEDGPHISQMIDELILQPIVTAKSFLALILWIIGQPVRAQLLAKEAIDDLDGLRGRNWPNTVCHVLCFAGAQLAEFLHDYTAVKAHSDEALKRAKEHNLPNWGGQANMVKGWALCKLKEDVPVGQRLLSDVLANIFKGDGSLYHLAHYLMMDADIDIEANELGAALRQIDKAKETCADTGERYWLSEVRRVEGEIFARQGNDELAEQCYRAAIEIAQDQKAISFELRATMSLARLWSGTGKLRRARRRLKNVHDKFTEGFETPDLMHAGELLARLG
jgi:predicted ATPase